MHEINKLRQRLRNVGRNVNEYRMTVEEAKSLVKEIEELERQLQVKPKEIIVMKDAPVIARNLDGGTF